ncbi:MAG: NAD(+)/NADH kinase [Oscillospiraceae bacterium]
MKIALLPNLTRKHALAVTNETCKNLDELSLEYFFPDNLKTQLDFNYKFLPQDLLLNSCDVVIAIGGDGSIIHAAKQAALYKKPILGINAGNLAFMAGIEKHELKMLANLAEHNYSIDKRMMLRVELNDSEKTNNIKYCLNDVVIARGEQIKLINLNISSDGKKINDYFADGVILSTPTGSTAYSLSAGGPVVDPKIESIMLTPICTHSLFARSIIFDKQSEIIVEIPTDNREKIFISCDGDNSFELKNGNKIIVKKAEISADFIRIKTDSFIDVLNSKLTQRRV